MAVLVAVCATPIVRIVKHGCCASGSNPFAIASAPARQPDDRNQNAPRSWSIVG
jgi:hypothetical protein